MNSLNDINLSSENVCENFRPSPATRDVETGHERKLSWTKARAPWKTCEISRFVLPNDNPHQHLAPKQATNNWYKSQSHDASGRKSEDQLFLTKLKIHENQQYLTVASCLVGNVTPQHKEDMNQQGEKHLQFFGFFSQPRYHKCPKKEACASGFQGGMAPHVKPKKPGGWKKSGLSKVGNTFWNIFCIFLFYRFIRYQGIAPAFKRHFCPSSFC